MNQTLQFDDTASAQLLAVYVTPDVAAQRQQIVQALALRPGQSVLDVGSGPGLLAGAMADIVGERGAVCGIDISEAMLAIAASHCADRPWARFLRSDAGKLPLADAAFDVAVVTQVLEYVSDVDAALLELARVLRPGGRLVVLDTDWDSIVWHSADRARMQRVLAAWDAHLVDPYLPRTLAGRLRKAGFELTAQQLIPMFNPEFAVETYSNRMIDFIAAFVAGREGISAEEAQAWARELRHDGAKGDYFFSVNRYLFVARKP